MKPASELTDGAWRARWGHYTVFLVLRDGRWHWAVGADGSNDPHVGSIAYHRVTESAHRAGWQLEAFGCRALVDGRRQDLVKFLAFDPIDAAEVAFIP